MAAKYLVTAPPGAPVPTVGFVRVGEVFTAPAGYVPSRTMKPLNDDAVAQLKKIKAELLRRADELDKGTAERDAETAKTERAYARALRADAASISLEAMEIPVEPPKIEEGIPLSQMGREAFAGTAAPGSDAKGPTRKL